MPKSRERKKVKARRKGRQTPPGSKRVAREMLETLELIQMLEDEYQQELLEELQNQSSPQEQYEEK